MKTGYLSDTEMEEAEEQYATNLRDELKLRAYIDDPFHPPDVDQHARIYYPIENSLGSYKTSYLYRLAQAHLPEFQRHR